MDLHSFLSFTKVTRGETAGTSLESNTSLDPSSKADGSSVWIPPSSDIPSDRPWEDGNFRITDSWSQALDTLLSGTSADKVTEKMSIPAISSSSPSSSHSVIARSTSSTTTAAGGSAGDGDLCHAEKEWQYILSTTPSDPFNIFATALAQGNSDGSAGDASRDIVYPTGGATDEVSAPATGLQQEQGCSSPPTVAPTTVSSHVSYPSDSRPPRSSAPFRLLGFPHDDDNAESVSPADLVQMPQQPLPAFPPFPLHLSSITANIMSLSTPFTPAPLPPARGLGGWNPAAPTAKLPQLLSTSRTLALPPLKPPCPQPSASLLMRRDETPYVPVVSLAKRRPRRSNVSSISSFREFDQDLPKSANSDDDEDSDVYQPSSSGESLVPSRHASPSTFRFPCTEVDRTVEAPPTRARSKGKAKGSAALALAVVTQISKLQRSADSPGDLPESHDGYDLDPEVLGIHPGRKRKNNPIPLPVPVPHLIKKSRGRKVPEAAPDAPFWERETEHLLEEEESAESSRNGRSTRGSRKSATPYSLGEGGKRIYKCEVAGCGKCFVRGEHLKRHIRSIHTYDKPHPCPYQGCDKTFSRRDNLDVHNNLWK